MCKFKLMETNGDEGVSVENSKEKQWRVVKGKVKIAAVYPEGESPPKYKHFPLMKAIFQVDKMIVKSSVKVVLCKCCVPQHFK